MVHQLDDALISQAQALGSLVRINRDGTYDLDFDKATIPEYAADRRIDFYEVRDAGNRTVARSPSLGPDYIINRPAGSGAWNVTLPGGRSGRAMAISVVPVTEDDAPPLDPQHPPAPVKVIVAQDRAPVSHVLDTLLVGLIVAVFTLCIVFAIVLRLVVTHGLAPLRSLARRRCGSRAGSAAHSLCHGCVAGRVAADRRATERCDRAIGDCLSSRAADWLGHCARTANADRRAANAGRCRLPLAAGCRSPARAVGRRAGDRLAHGSPSHGVAFNCPLATNVCCRAPAGFTCRHRARLARARRQAAARASRKPRAARMRRRQRPAAAGQLVHNLLDNAVVHGDAGTVAIAAELRDGQWRLHISNTTHALTADDLPHLFEPFWRKDASRTSAAHCGLGLTLVASYAHQLGVTVTPSLSPDGRFEVCVAGLQASSAAAVTMHQSAM